ncbi:MAG: ribosome silencing factor [Candidatus Azotimanducaceae bacterium]|uniref:Ribosomal silencing factor RsfS n=1 Tax=OM182 bacterium TaxID=2510334 RepID=A0A520S1Y7_9GAMM|nr:ribosome silencing factor [Gammaproteobacteria bacterium]OUV67060.1 MAG: ribosome silencing factor [Gammaproteobacteria bacterium TMED133]RZO76493.1 MAG: ribosome silencing factor [OM182 bacterium]
MPNLELKDMVIQALINRKGEDIQCLEVFDQTDITDYMVVASGTSVRQVKALGESVIEEVRRIHIKPIGVEGMLEGEWVLVDLADVLVHVMLPKVREFYDLERLWSMSPSQRELQE